MCISRRFEAICLGEFEAISLGEHMLNSYLTLFMFLFSMTKLLQLGVNQNVVSRMLKQVAKFGGYTGADLK